MDAKDWETLEQFRPGSNEFIDWLKTYGPMESFSTDFDPNDFEANRIWTESWRNFRLVSGDFEDSSNEGSYVTGYFVSAVPRSADSGLILIKAECYVPCTKCKYKNENESCVECDGEFEYLVDFCELIF